MEGGQSKSLQDLFVSGGKDVDKVQAAERVEQYYEQYKKERKASWFSPIIATLGYPERLSPEIIEDNIKIAEKLEYENEDGKSFELTEAVKSMQESVKVFGGDSRVLYEKDLHYIVGKEHNDTDTLEEKAKWYLSPTVKGERVCWFWKKSGEQWEMYKGKDLQLAIEINYRERRPSVRVDEDHYIMFANMKQYRYDNSSKKRRVKRELVKIEDEEEAATPSIVMEKIEEAVAEEKEKEGEEKQQRKKTGHGKTIVRVLDEDCIGATLALEAEVGVRPLLLNLAQRWSEHVCGGWSYSYKGSQEEWIERHSAVYRLGLDPKLNPYLADIHRNFNYGQLPRNHVPEFGTVFLANVPILRARDYHFLPKYCLIDVVAAGAVDLRKHVTSTRDHERDYYVRERSFTDSFNSLPWVRHNKRVTLNREDQKEEDEGKEPAAQYPERDLEEQGLDGALFDEHTRMKIRMVLCTAVALGYRHLVLGALGCGAFMNPTRRVATLYKQCLTEKRFKGKFDVIVFAILGEGNAEPFSQVFSEGEI